MWWCGLWVRLNWPVDVSSSRWNDMKQYYLETWEKCNEKSLHILCHFTYLEYLICDTENVLSPFSRLQVNVTLAHSERYTFRNCDGCQYSVCLCGEESRTFSWIVTPATLGTFHLLLLLSFVNPLTVRYCRSLCLLTIRSESTFRTFISINIIFV